MNATPDISMLSSPMANEMSRRGRQPAGPAAPTPRFDSLVRQAGSADGAYGPAAEEPAREAAEELVAFALVMPMMKMARNSPFKSELFHGGRGEKAFGNRLDQLLARRIVGGSNLPVVDAVHRQLTGPGAEVDHHA